MNENAIRVDCNTSLSTQVDVSYQVPDRKPDRKPVSMIHHDRVGQRSRDRTPIAYQAVQSLLLVEPV